MIRLLLLLLLVSCSNGNRYNLGDTVKIVEGTYNGMYGTIRDILCFQRICDYNVVLTYPNRKTVVISESYVEKIDLTNVYGMGR